MRVFKTGIQVSQAVKNVQRLRTILGVLGRHGFNEILNRMGLEKYTSKRDETADPLTIPERLRRSFEELGPTFIKLGQLLANRPDMLPEAYIEELKKLQDNVAPVAFEAMKNLIEKEIGGKIESKFASFNSTPIACASIAQVYEATLLSGEEVALKVQRPEIAHIIQQDVSILTFLAELMEKYIPETAFISPTQIVDEFFTSLHYELDFLIEANTAVKVAENLKNNPRVVIPKVYREYSTHKVLVLEKIKGIKITNVQALKEQGIDPKELVDIGARAFVKMLMVDGLFHGDLHGGNIFALKDAKTGQAKIGLIDFGIVGRMSDQARDALARMLVALMTEDYETLCYEYADLGAVGVGVDFDSFQREVRNSLSPYMGLSLKDVRVGPILIDSTRIAMKYRIRIPRDWMIVFKAIFSLEGLGRQLDPEFDFLSIGHDIAKTLTRERFTKERLFKDIAFVAKDISALVRVAPRQIRWMFRKFNSNDFAFEIKLKEIEVLRRQIEKSSRGIGFSIMTAGLFIAAAASLNAQATRSTFGGYSIPVIIFFILGFFSFLKLIFSNWK